MSDLSSAISRYNEFVGTDVSSLASTIGINAAQAALHYSFPNDFEYYMMALELVSYDGRTIDYFVFPVNPNSYSQSEPSGTNIQSTMNGVSAVGTSSFIPISIMMQGNFGRKFKVLVGSDTRLDLSVAQYSTTDGAFTNSDFTEGGGRFRKSVMNSRVKTGYGAMKILQAICLKSRGSIDGKPNRLYMYNPAFGANYMVKVVNFKPSQSNGTNMIWGYDLQMTAIAPLEAMVGSDNARNSLSEVMTKSVVQKSANVVLNQIARIL